MPILGAYKEAILPDGNWLVGVVNNPGGYVYLTYQINQPNVLQGGCQIAIPGYLAYKNPASATAPIGPPPNTTSCESNTKLGTTTTGGTLVDKWPLLGIKLPNGNVITYNISSKSFDIPVTDATKAGGTSAYNLSDLLRLNNFGANDSRVKLFLTDSDNAGAINQAVSLGYESPTQNNSDAVHKINSLYWAAYYSSEFPLPTNPMITDCDTVLQTIQSLKDTYASIQQQQSTYSANNFYVGVTQEDLQIQLQVVTDLQRAFNALNSKLACTKTESLGGSSLVTWVVIGFAAVIGIIVIKRIFHKQAA